MAQQTSETAGGGGRGWVALQRIQTTAVATFPITLDYGFPLYKLNMQNIIAGDDKYIYMQVNVGGTAQVATTDYAWMGDWIDSVGAEAVQKVNGGIDSTGFPLIGSDEGAASENPATGTGDSGFASVLISGLNDTTATYYEVNSMWDVQSETFTLRANGITLLQEACDGVTVLTESSNFETAGLIYVEGYNA